MKFIWGLPCILPLGKCRKGKSEVQGCEKKKSQLFDSSLHRKSRCSSPIMIRTILKALKLSSPQIHYWGGGIDYSVASSSAQQLQMLPWNHSECILIAVGHTGLLIKVSVNVILQSMCTVSKAKIWKILKMLESQALHQKTSQKDLAQLTTYCVSILFVTIHWMPLKALNPKPKTHFLGF